MTVASLEAALSRCAHGPNIRILRRVHDLKHFPLTTHPVGQLRRICLLDTETTGTDPLRDEIIDIAAVMLLVDELGQITEIRGRGQGLQQPGCPLPEYITALTGLTDDDLRGQSFNLDRLERFLGSADVLVAHQASFDAAFVSQLPPGLRDAAWACSATEFDWLSGGYDGRKLGHLLMQVGHFNTAHRAMSDVVSLLHVLAEPALGLPLTVMGALLAKAEQPTVRIEATGAPFDKRAELKAGGYRWSPAGKVWWTEFAQADEAAEIRWLQQLNPWGREPHTRRITWHQRHR